MMTTGFKGGNIIFPDYTTMQCTSDKVSGVLRFSRNRSGRDFVVGDIHGCFSLLEAMLSQIAFDPQHDRLFSVGDLIDRGPESQRALEFLDYPWFHAVRGNHEVMLIEALSGDNQFVMRWLENGGGWCHSHLECLSVMSSAFSDLPWAIEIETKAGIVGIVHADVPKATSWESFTEALRNGDRKVQEIAVWSRKRFHGYDSTQVAGISKVFCGHSICQDGRPFHVDNVNFIDTGAYLAHNYNDRDAGLTLFDINSMTYLTSKIENSITAA
jgi:serine/threonine protein phosphatase 1